jgi:crossover junction endodeoxyribonuclease RuvC
MPIILGIDPGSNLLGFAFLDCPSKGKPRLIRMDVIDLRGEDQQAEKLKQIFEDLQTLIKLYEPQQAAIEAPFYGKDVQAMLKLGRAQGVAMLAVACAGLSIVEYSPRSVKKAVTGKGNATKEQVARMLQHMVEGDLSTTYLDASDALGVAYCHYLNTQKPQLGGKKYDSWSSFVKDNPNRKN